MKGKQNRKYWIILALACLIYALVWGNPFGRLAIGAAFDPMYFNGFATLVHLPPTATAAEVAAKAYPYYPIVMSLPMFGRTAVWVLTGSGSKIVLVEHDGPIGWSAQLRDP